MRREVAALGATLVLVLPPGSGAAEPEGPSSPDPSLAVVTLDAPPLPIAPAGLPEAARLHVEQVLARSVLGQRVSGIRHRSREAVFRFLVDRPEFAAAVVRALRLRPYRLTPLDEGYWGDDGRGASGVVRVLYADEGRRLYHLEGRYDHPRHPTVEGQLLLLLEFRHEEDAGGEGVVEVAVTGHLRLDTPLVGALARAVASLSRPLVERVVERKVRRFFDTVARLSRWAYEQPEQLVAALDGNPEVVQGPTLVAFRGILLADRPPAWARAPLRLLVASDP